LLARGQAAEGLLDPLTRVALAALLEREFVDGAFASLAKTSVLPDRTEKNSVSDAGSQSRLVPPSDWTKSFPSSVETVRVVVSCGLIFNAKRPAYRL
jgi:hypothetical protein